MDDPLAPFRVHAHDGAQCHSRRAFIGRAGLLGLGVALGPRVARPQADAPRGASFRPAGPLPLADTRSGFGFLRPDGSTIRVATAGVAGVPRDAAAVAIAVTALARSSTGFLTVWASGGRRPSTRALSFRAGQRVATSVFVETAGSIDVSWGITGGAGEPAVLVDLYGWFAPEPTATQGRWTPISRTRVLDTRASGALQPGDGVVAQRPPAVPRDATAAVVVLTVADVDDPDGAGAWTLWAADSPAPPAVAQLRTDGTARSRTVWCVVPLGGAGIAVTTSSGGHATLDVVGYFTGPSAPASSDGLFVPTTPQRVLDTRPATPAGGSSLVAGTQREIVGAGDGRAWAAAITTYTPDTSQRGKGDDAALSAYPAGTRPPGPAIAGPRLFATETSFAVLGRSTRGTALDVGFNGDIAIDSYGWFTGTPATADWPAQGQSAYGIQNVAIEEMATEWFDYGLSTDGRPLRAFRLGRGRRHAMVVSHLHGDEWTGESVIVDIARRGALDGWTLWLLPNVNPDARAANMRYTHGVNMNRDFPWGWEPQVAPVAERCVINQTGPNPFTLVESRRLRDVIETGAIPCEVVISHHDNYNWVAPASLAGGDDEVAAALRPAATEYAAAVGLRVPGEAGFHTSNTYTRVNGGFESWARSIGKKALLIENKTGATADNDGCGMFGIRPAAVDVEPHFSALRRLLSVV